MHDGSAQTISGAAPEVLDNLNGTVPAIDPGEGDPFAGHDMGRPAYATPDDKFQTTEDDDDVIEREVFMHLDAAQLAPHGDRYIVQKLRIGDKMRVDSVAGSKILYTSSKDDEEQNGFYFARIIAKGTGHRLETNTIVPMPFEPGDIVMVEKYSGRPYSLYNDKMVIKPYITVNQVDILTAVPEISPPRPPGFVRHAFTSDGATIVPVG